MLKKSMERLVGFGCSRRLCAARTHFLGGVIYDRKNVRKIPVLGRVADPDPSWIRIQEGKNDPEKKKKVKKIHVLKCCMDSFES
jgi:hypothetical protein